MKFVIRPAARQDILNQVLYLIGQNALGAAARFVDAVDETILELASQPTIGAPKKLKNRRLEGLRKWSVKGFEVMGIYYLLEDDLLRVVRVLHGKRDVERVLEEETEASANT